MKKKTGIAFLSILLFLSIIGLVSCKEEEPVPQKLGTPQNLSIIESGPSLSWDAVANATSYEVSINGLVYTSYTNLYNLSGLTASKSYNIKVRSLSIDPLFLDSDYSEEVVFDKYSSNLIFRAINNNTEYEVSKGVGDISGFLRIQPTYGGKPVTAIALDAFKDCANITSVEIPESVTIIKNSAFLNCTKLASVSFGDSSQLEDIGYYAFSNSGLTSIKIPSTVKNIDYGAFYSCKNLASVIFESGSQLESIGWNTFSYSIITTISIPSSVTSLGSMSFAYCTKLVSVFFESDSQLEVLADNIFSQCYYLKEILLPKSISTIRPAAFQNTASSLKIYFYGTEAEWSEIIKIDSGLRDDAEIYFNYTK